MHRDTTFLVTWALGPIVALAVAVSAFASGPPQPRPPTFCEKVEACEVDVCEPTSLWYFACDRRARPIDEGTYTRERAFVCTLDMGEPRKVRRHKLTWTPDAFRFVDKMNEGYCEPGTGRS
jgi:hypothetical protein